MPLPPVQGRVEKPNIEQTLNGAGIIPDKVVCNCGPGIALAVNGHPQLLQNHCLGAFLPQVADIIRKAEAAGYLAHCIVISPRNKDRNTRIPQAAHARGKIQAGAIVPPVPIIKIPGDEYKVHLFLQG